MIVKTKSIDAYKYYKKNNEDALDNKTYLLVANGFVKFMMSKVLDGYEVALSHGDSLGNICGRGRKPNIKITSGGGIMGLAPDRAGTHRLWQTNPEAKEKGNILFFTNEHSNGISYRLEWLRTNIKVQNNNFYTLIFTKGPLGVKRAFSKRIKAGQEYLIIDKNK